MKCRKYTILKIFLVNKILNFDNQNWLRLIQWNFYETNSKNKPITMEHQQWTELKIKLVSNIQKISNELTTSFKSRLKQVYWRPDRHAASYLAVDRAY